MKKRSESFFRIRCAETLSDSDGDEDLAYQKVYNVLLDAVSNYHYGESVESCLTDEDRLYISLRTG